MIEAEYGEWLARGHAHQLAARPIDALLCYRRALKSNRNAVQVHFHLGEVLRDLGRRDEALAAFRTALMWQPKHLPSLLALGDMLRTSGARRGVRVLRARGVAGAVERCRSPGPGIVLARVERGARLLTTRAAHGPRRFVSRLGRPGPHPCPRFALDGAKRAPSIHRIACRLSTLGTASRGGSRERGRRHGTGQGSGTRSGRCSGCACRDHR